MSSIDILVPVLNRPQNARPLVESFRAGAAECELHFLCTPGDDEQIAACMAHPDVSTMVVDWPAGAADYARKMNYGFEHTSNEFVLLGADDIRFEPGWDRIALDLAKRTKADVIGTNDCANRLVQKGRFSTHALVRRSYVEELGASLDGPGILVSEAYDHNFVDRELCHLAQQRRRWAFAPNSRVTHSHPCWGTAPPDATYTKGARDFRSDQDLFYQRSLRWDGVGLLSAESGLVRRAQRRKRILHRRGLR